MSDARIASQDARVGRVGNRFVRGNQVMAALVDGLTPPVASGRNEDLQNSRALFAWSPFPVPLPPGSGGANGPTATGSNGPGSVSRGRWGGGGRGRGGGPGGNQGEARGYSGRYPSGSLVDEITRGLFPSYACPPAPVPLAVPRLSPRPAGLPSPAPPTAGFRAPVFTAPAPAAAPAPAMSAADAQALCRTGEICRDLRSGCVLQSQLSTDQVIACAVRGWQGNQSLFPGLASRSDLPYLGTVDLNPPQASDFGVRPQDLAAADRVRAALGLSGVELLPAGLTMTQLFSGLAVFGAMYWLASSTKHRGRR